MRNAKSNHKKTHNNKSFIDMPDFSFFNQFFILKFKVAKKLFQRFKKSSVKWKLCRKLPSIFFFPHMELDEYILFNKMSLKKKIILEYGSGGSTIQFIKSKKKVYSVESNPDFYKYMNSITLVKKATEKSLFLKFINLGDTDSWGRPLSLERKENWPDYYSEVWKDIVLNENKVDVVFIDGRFRVCCCVYSIIKILENNWKETIFMIHDFWNRKEYFVLLKFLDEIESKSRLGVFAIKKDINIHEINSILPQYSSMY